MEEMKYTYAELQKRYKRVLEQKKKYDKEATQLYYQSTKLKKKIKELEDEIKRKDKKIKDLELINTMMYDKIYKGE